MSVFVFVLFLCAKHFRKIIRFPSFFAVWHQRTLLVRSWCYDTDPTFRHVVHSIKDQSTWSKNVSSGCRSRCTSMSSLINFMPACVILLPHSWELHKLESLTQDSCLLAGDQSPFWISHAHRVLYFWSRHEHHCDGNADAGWVLHQLSGNEIAAQVDLCLGGDEIRWDFSLQLRSFSTKSESYLRLWCQDAKCHHWRQDIILACPAWECCIWTPSPFYQRLFPSFRWYGSHHQFGGRSECWIGHCFGRGSHVHLYVHWMSRCHLLRVILQYVYHFHHHVSVSGEGLPCWGFTEPTG